MPLYDYECKKCGHDFSKALKMSEKDDPLSEDCPECSATDSIIKIIGSPRITSGRTFNMTEKMGGIDPGVAENLKRIRSQNPNLSDSALSYL